MYKKVEEDPTRSVLEIYEEVRNGFTEGMNQSAMQSFLQEFPTWRSMQSQLYKKRREYIPANPIDMKDMETDSEWFNYNKQTLESIVKGDALLEDGRRVVLMSTDDHLDLMARAPQLLGDGTFRVTPSQWLQTFIISAHIFGAIFVPVCFVLLPDKKRETYDLMFSLLKDALSVRGLELSASNFMSDFEVAIRDSFTEHFPGISPKGCQFHFSKAIISKVSKSGFKSDYSNKSCLKFSSFIRSIIGLAFVPLDRFSEGVRNLFVLAKRLSGRQKKFAVKMIDYVSRVWVNGHYPPETWNMFQHEGVTTNNNSEAYNFRLGNKKRISKHPNVYLFVSVIIEELKASMSDAVMAKTGNINKKSWSAGSKKEKNAKMKETLVDKLKENNIELICYQQAMGGATIQSSAVRDVDFSNTEKLNLGGGEEEICVPELHEIVVPLSVSALRRSDPEEVRRLEVSAVVEQQSVRSQYRTVSGSQKRKSDLSYSVGGAQLATGLGI